jgi:hypothetical protein
MTGALVMSMLSEQLPFPILHKSWATPLTLSLLSWLQQRPEPSRYNYIERWAC